jgi:hypothetical protein
MGAGREAGPIPCSARVYLRSGYRYELGKVARECLSRSEPDVHRKRSQVAVVDRAGESLANRNVPNGVETILGVIGDLPVGTPAAFEAAFGWGWLVELPHLVRGPGPGPAPGPARVNRPGSAGGSLRQRQCQ